MAANGRPGRPGAPGRPAGPRRPRAPGGSSAASSAGEAGGRPAEAVTALLTGPLVAAGFDLETVTVTRAGARYLVVVAVDRDGGLDLDAVAAASHVVSDALDAHEDELPAALRDAYTLEVSSRGATAPLTLPRHWRRAAGRLVEVRRRGGQGEVTGRVTDSDDDGADLDVAGAALRVPFADVARAVVQLEFRRPAGSDDSQGDEDADDEDADDGVGTDEETAP